LWCWTQQQAGDVTLRLRRSRRTDEGSVLNAAPSAPLSAPNAPPSCPGGRSPSACTLPRPPVRPLAFAERTPCESAIGPADHGVWWKLDQAASSAMADYVLGVW